MNSKSFFLIHGGGLDSRCWDPLLPLLDAPAKAIDLPGRGSRPGELRKLHLADFVEAAVCDLDKFTATEKVVLVGHSMAGITIPAVAAARPHRVEQLVFISCYIPHEGKSVLNEMPLWLRALIRVASILPPRALDPRVAHQVFCNDMTEEQTTFTLSGLIPEAPNVLRDPVSRSTLPAHSELPRTYIKLTQDRALGPALQDRFIENLGECRTLEISGGHCAMISRPAELANALNSLSSPDAWDQLRGSRPHPRDTTNR